MRERAAGLGLRDERDVADAATGFVRDLLALETEMWGDGYSHRPTLTPDGCMVVVGGEDEEQAVLVGIAGEPGKYSITAADLATWQSDPDASAPDLALAVEGDELVVDLGWSCDYCSRAVATLDLGAPEGLDDAELRGQAETDTEPISFRLRLPRRGGAGPGALLVHVRDREGRLVGLCSEVVDVEALRGSDAALPDCERLASPSFAGGTTVAQAAERFAHDTMVGWPEARW